MITAKLLITENIQNYVLSFANFQKSFLIWIATIKLYLYRTLMLFLN